MLFCHLIAKYPNQPRGVYFDFHDVLDTARIVFSRRRPIDSWWKHQFGEDRDPRTLDSDEDEYERSRFPSHTQAACYLPEPETQSTPSQSLALLSPSLPVQLPPHEPHVSHSPHAESLPSMIAPVFSSTHTTTTNKVRLTCLLRPKGPRIPHVAVKSPPTFSLHTFDTLWPPLTPLSESISCFNVPMPTPPPRNSPPPPPSDPTICLPSTPTTASTLLVPNRSPPLLLDLTADLLLPPHDSSFAPLVPPLDLPLLPPPSCSATSQPSILTTSTGPTPPLPNPLLSQPSLLDSAADPHASLVEISPVPSQFPSSLDSLPSHLTTLLTVTTSPSSPVLASLPSPPAALLFLPSTAPSPCPHNAMPDSHLEEERLENTTRKIHSRNSTSAKQQQPGPRAQGRCRRTKRHRRMQQDHVFHMQHHLPTLPSPPPQTTQFTPQKHKDQVDQGRSTS
ncbi:hypothetical protein BC827DRAFT_1265209 [Russula dissimulans]|nr:hypothetical protein BC827DRAFT_1265209 [Russula dissimulans]